MKLKIILKRPVMITCIVGITFSSLLFFFPTFVLPTQDTTKPIPSVTAEDQNKLNDNASVGSILGVTFPQDSADVPLESVQSSTPKTNVPKNQSKVEFSLHLKIPKINVNAGVESVGLTADGLMDAPKGATNVALFNRGPRPGEEGSAVITGHYGQWEDGKDSVFDDLHKLEKGDIIYIEEEDGTTISFVVRELRTYAEDDDATEVFVSDDGKAHLNLITCSGIWDKSTNTYSHRLVVFTDKE